MTTPAPRTERSIVAVCFTVVVLVTTQLASHAQTPGATSAFLTDGECSPGEPDSEGRVPRDEPGPPGTPGEQPAQKKAGKKSAKTTAQGVALHLGKHPLK